MSSSPITFGPGAGPVRRSQETEGPAAPRASSSSVMDSLPRSPEQAATAGYRAAPREYHLTTFFKSNGESARVFLEQMLSPNTVQELGLGALSQKKQQEVMRGVLTWGQSFLLSRQNKNPNESLAQSYLAIRDEFRQALRSLLSTDDGVSVLRNMKVEPPRAASAKAAEKAHALITNVLLHWGRTVSSKEAVDRLAQQLGPYIDMTQVHPSFTRMPPEERLRTQLAVVADWTAALVLTHDEARSEVVRAKTLLSTAATQQAQRQDWAQAGAASAGFKLGN